MDELEHIRGSTTDHEEALRETADIDGRVVRRTGTGPDVIARAEVEARLEASEQRFATVFRASPAGLAISRLSDGRYLDVNDSFARVLGYTREELVGRSSVELGLLSPEERARLVAELQSRGWLRNVESTVVTRSGERVFVLASLEHTEITGEKCIVSSLVDISEHKRLQRALETSERRLRTIFETEPECVKVTTHDGTLLDMNAAGLAMIEAADASEVVGRKLFPLVQPEHRDAFAEMTRKAAAGEPGSLVLELEGLKGTPRWMETRAVSLPGEAGERPHVLAITRDVTERRELQVLQLLAGGRTVKEIAAELALSVKTVSTYRTRLLEKLDLKTNAALIAYALRNGVGA